MVGWEVVGRWCWLPSFVVGTANIRRVWDISLSAACLICCCSFGHVLAIRSTTWLFQIICAVTLCSCKALTNDDMVVFVTGASAFSSVAVFCSTIRNNLVNDELSILIWPVCAHRGHGGALAIVTVLFEAPGDLTFDQFCASHRLVVCCLVCTLVSAVWDCTVNKESN